MRKMLTTEEAAEVLGLTPETLKRMRFKGAESDVAPIPYFKYSRRCVRYNMADLEAWIEARRADHTATPPGDAA